MAGDDSKLQFDVELSEGSVQSSFKAVDERAAKSAKASAAVFGEAFQKQENDLKDSISRITRATKEEATKSAQESARVFEKYYADQEKLAKSQSKYFAGLQKEALNQLSGGSNLSKSAKDSADVFKDAFEKGLLSGNDIGQTFGDKLQSFKSSIGDITQAAAGLYIAKQAFDALQSSAKAMLDVVVNGEKEIKLDKTFERLATEAGIAASVLKNELLVASNGFIDETALLEKASEAFILIGNNAKQLPQILDLGRKAYAAFGGDVVENTDKIVQAIATGQTRQLKAIGLQIDNTKVLKEYAAELGTVPELLTEAQQQQARLNAVLERGAEKFKGVSDNTGVATDAFRKLNTEATNLFDEFSKAQSKNFGGIFSAIADGARAVVSKIAEAYRTDVNGAEYAQKRYNDLKKQLADNANPNKGFFDIGLSSEQVKNITALMAGYKKTIDSAATSQRNLKEEAQKAAAVAAPGAVGPDTNSSEYVARKQAEADKLLALNNAVQASNTQRAQDEFSRLDSEVNLTVLTNARKAQENARFLQERAALDKFFNDSGINDKVIQAQAAELLEQEHTNRMKQIRDQDAQERKQGLADAATDAAGLGEAYTGIMEGIQDEARATAQNTTKEFKKIGAGMRQFIGQAAGNAFAAFGEALVTGEDALGAFAKSLFASFGQMAIKLGTEFILIGIAENFLVPGSGTPLIGAGAALAAFGGVISALAGGGGAAKDVSGGGGTAAGGVGSIADNDFVNRPVDEKDIAAKTPDTRLNLTINGNVLDRRETGLEIAKILEEQFADQGLQIRGVG